jgi:sn-glycerol 3-phosphate transport system substrate-binding protein
MTTFERTAMTTTVPSPARAPGVSRLVGVALAGALALAGCSSSGDNAGSTSTSGLPSCPVTAINDAQGPVDVLVWYQLSGKTKDSLLAQIDKYNRSQSKVRVRAESQGASYEELFDAYKRGLPTGQLPDIAVMEETATRFMVDSGTVLPAQSCFEAEKLSTDGFNQAAVNYYKVGGVLYPASASLSDIVTYYNKAHFRRAGLPDKAPETLEEVRAYAQKLKDAGVTDKPVVLKLAPWFLETQLTGSHQAVVDNDNGHGSGQTTKATFDTDVTRKIFTWVQAMIRDGLLNPKPDTPGQFDHFVAMAQTTASITVETSTAAPTIAAFLSGDTAVGTDVGTGASTTLTKADVGVGPVFGVNGAGKAQIGGNAFYIVDRSKALKKSMAAEQSASWDFLKWWNQPDQQRDWHIQGGYLPFLSSAAQLPEVQAFWTDDTAGKILKVAWDELSKGMDPTFAGPHIGPFAQTREVLRASLDSVAFAKGEPGAAVTDAVPQVDAALKAYNEGL